MIWTDSGARTYSHYDNNVKRKNGGTRPVHIAPNSTRGNFYTKYLHHSPYTILQSLNPRPVTAFA